MIQIILGLYASGAAEFPFPEPFTFGKDGGDAEPCLEPSPGVPLPLIGDPFDPDVEFAVCPSVVAADVEGDDDDIVGVRRGRGGK